MSMPTLRTSESELGEGHSDDYQGEPILSLPGRHRRSHSPRSTRFAPGQQNHPLRSHHQQKRAEMMDLVCRALYQDTEEAAILCLSICFNLCRVFRNVLEPKLNSLMEFIRTVGILDTTAPAPATPGGSPGCCGLQRRDMNLFLHKATPLQAVAGIHDLALQVANKQ